jgi:hypothetical protein
MKGFLPLRGRNLSPHLVLFTVLFLFCSISLVQAKTVVIGSGSGFLSVPNMNGLNPGDVLAINPGKYAGGAFNNLN